MRISLLGFWWLKYGSWVSASRDLDTKKGRVFFSLFLAAMGVVGYLFGRAAFEYFYISFAAKYEVLGWVWRCYSALMGLVCLVPYLAVLAVALGTLPLLNDRYKWSEHLGYCLCDHKPHLLKRLLLWRQKNRLRREHRLFEFPSPAGSKHGK